MPLLRRLLDELAEALAEHEESPQAQLRAENAQLREALAGLREELKQETARCTALETEAFEWRARGKNPVSS